MLYPFPQLMLQNLSQFLGASLQLDANPAKVSNAGSVQMLRTEGQATLSDFFVAPQNRSQASSLLSLRELSQGRTVQLGKGI